MSTPEGTTPWDSLIDQLEKYATALRKIGNDHHNVDAYTDEDCRILAQSLIDTARTALRDAS